MINANGGKGWGTYWAHRDDPVFEPSFDGDTTYPNGDKLPGIWITEPILDDEGGYDGRTYIMVYPAPSFYDEFHPGADPDDEDGGIGCEPDAASAYSWYLRASKLALNGETPVVLGSIALRLAGCFEEGFGCEQSFSCALQIYRHAADALEFAVENGDPWYAKALADARAGVKRCIQEIG